jgi:hypothetical protein
MHARDDLRVVPFTDDRLPNPYPGGVLPWQEYHAVRNAVVRACRAHGLTGVMGEVTIDPAVADPYLRAARDPGFWPRGDDPCAFYVIPDQYNHERYVYAEVLAPAALTTSWIESIATVLREHAGWGLGVGNIQDSYLLVFGDRVRVKGRLASCRTVGDVSRAAERLLRRGRRKWWQFWKK